MGSWGQEVNQSTTSLKDVAATYNSTHIELLNCERRFADAASSVRGVSSEATAMLKGVVAGELLPEVQRIITIFEGLGEGIQRTGVQAEQAKASADDAVRRFRGQLGGS
jgi:hypothetical protein